MYSMVDNLTTSQTSRQIHETAFRAFDFGLSSAMGWIYFVMISLVLWIVTLLMPVDMYDSTVGVSFWRFFRSLLCTYSCKGISSKAWSEAVS
ncbi:hypothetical protein M3194_21285 [Paenibacillus glycanilyticus]|uniref:hypothetical protein n=1 Tax=Paenibacillus glycanilyticus TaxID=126569 RepID=UPI00203D2251|nr:hypothetical protein [Paenibacillus glycanilyticus]MCM3629870.1 hypothetical protein [Paenibacillus glycanilyticus]